MTDLSYKIRRLRELQNLSQEYLASQLGISQRAYSYIESGQTQLSVIRLHQIAGVLQCGAGDLLEKALEDLAVQYFKPG